MGESLPSRRLDRKQERVRVFEHENVVVELWRFSRRHTRYVFSRPWRQVKDSLIFYAVRCFANSTCVEVRFVRGRYLATRRGSNLYDRARTFFKTYCAATWDGWGNGTALTKKDQRLVTLMEQEIYLAEESAARQGPKSEIIKTLSDIEEWKNNPTRSGYSAYIRKARFG